MFENNRYKKNDFFSSNIMLLSIRLIFNILIIKCEITYCPRETPILISDECKLQYCSKQEFESGYCKIKNDIIKTQWLNNIIAIGDYKYRYINFASYSNGDMVVETTTYPGTTGRKFYGIKSNGRPLFTKSSKETPYYYKEVGDTIGHFEAESIIVKTTDNKELFFSLSKLEGYAEMFDLQNDNLLRATVAQFTNHDYIYSLRHTIVPFTDSYNNNKYFIGVVASENNQYDIYFKEYTFNSYSNFFVYFYTASQPSQIRGTYGYMVSCYKTDNGFIVCSCIMFSINSYIYNILRVGSMHMYTFPFYINDKKADQNIFFKCIHLRGEVGVFAYYNNVFNGFFFSYTQIYMIFLEYNNGFTNYISNDYTISLNLPNSINNLLLNDLIKISENKICFTSLPSDKNTINIVIINIYNNKKIKIRYYSIPSFSLYHYKILLDIRIHPYKNIITFGSSFCQNDPCEEDKDQHNSSLILFSYPNATDYTLDLEKYLFDNNGISINNLTIDLKDHIIIENNIFGYIYDSISIQNMKDCQSLELFSSENPTEEIRVNKDLHKNEKILLNLKKTENVYENINCTLEYVYKVTEPEIDVYNNYTSNMEGDDDSDSFTKDIYTGRLTYYGIILNRELSTNCENNDCVLCLKNQNDFCITCKYNFTLSQDNNKNCYHLDEETEKPTESPTEAITEKPTEAMTEKPTESPTEALTEKPTEKPTEAMTEKPTESPTEAMTEKPTEKLTEAMTEKPTEKPTESMTEKMDKLNENECTDEQIISNYCSDKEINENQIEPILDYLEKTYVNINLTDKDVIVKTKNVLFEVCSHETQKNNNNPDISSVDLGECENKLKSYYKIDEDLIILKTDIKSSDLSKTFVQYQVYNPYDLTPLKLDICKEEKIIISAPVKLDESVSTLYDSLKESGYNLFNESDKFYTDICSSYTSEYGTDMILEDRKDEILLKKANVSLCQENCKLLNYSSSTNKAQCECSPQIEKIDSGSIYSDIVFFINNIKNNTFFFIFYKKLCINSIIRMASKILLQLNLNFENKLIDLL